MSIISITTIFMRQLWLITYCYILTGPTSFAPIIEMAITIVEQSGGQYHVLLIIADGQVLFNFNTLAI